MLADQEVIDYGWDQYVHGLKDTHVDIGILPEDGGDPVNNSITLAELGNIHEYGRIINTTAKQRSYLSSEGFYAGSTITIPKRPFMRVSFDENLSELKKFVADIEFKVLTHGIKIETALDRIGELHQYQIQRNIKTKGKFASNHPFTVFMKGSDNELVDTETLFRTISNKVYGV